MARQKKVLVLGADGFIGRHIAFALRRRGRHVIACARRTARLERMGFDTLCADLTDPGCHDPGFWRARLAGGVQVVNAAGLLTGSARNFEAVHSKAPAAVYQAQEVGAGGVLISAVGIDEGQTRFARARLNGEALAQDHGLTILRPGLVLANTSYGGSSLLRALAAFPFCMPLVGKGDQRFNPIHASDLADVIAECLLTPPGKEPFAVGGPERLSQRELLETYRSWLGLPKVGVLHLPLPLARGLGKIGDALRLGPISSSSVAQLQAGVAADETALLQRIKSRPRKARDFIHARPAGTQDLWHARLYLLRPALRLTLAVLWLVSGLIGLFLPAETFLPLVTGTSLPDTALTALARLGGLADLAVALALLRNWRPGLMAGTQAVIVLGYTLTFSLLTPILWLLPLGGLLKNLPVLALIAVWAALEDER